MSNRQGKWQGVILPNCCHLGTELNKSLAIMAPMKIKSTRKNIVQLTRIPKIKIDNGDFDCTKAM
uniref:Uncharacterized protein n=1 Tax=Romanomermis culicivorax TaxID=13658 RepID=A0A915KPW8_ROMCU